MSLPDSTNPRVMADNIKRLEAIAGGSGLPEITSEDAGKVLTVSDDGEWEVEDPVSGLTDYTTSEQETGNKYLDSAIYKKTYTGTIARGEYAAYYRQTLEDFTGKNLLFVEGFIEDSTNHYRIPINDLQRVDSAGNIVGYPISITQENTNFGIGIPTNTSAVGLTYNITAYYTKTTNEAKKTTRKSTKTKESEEK